MTRKLLPLLLATVACSALAQSIQLDIGLECESYVLYESVPLTLRVTNRGASPYIVDDYGDYKDNSLSIVLRHESDGFQEQARQGLPFGTLMVSPQASHTVACRLNDWFSLLRQGKYSVQVFAKRGAETIASRLVVFSVVKGLDIVTETHMLPESDTQARRYSLLYWPRKQREDLFLRVEDDPGGTVTALFRLGSVVRYVQPRFEFGDNGRVCVIHQIGRDRFVRTVFQSDASTLEVVDQQQLVDPSQAVMARSILENRERERDPGENPAEFRRRKRPAKPDDAKDTE